MEIIGQERVLSIIVRIINESDNLVHLLLVAPSGHGKSLIGKFTAKLLYNKYGKKILYFSTGENLENLIMRKPGFKFEDYIILVDEIHLLYHPEIIFPLFDKCHIIATTNIMGLPEALENRFLQITLDRYNEKELKQIFEYYLGDEITEEELSKFLAISTTPRELKKFAQLYKYLKNDFWKLVATPDGLTTEEIEYITALKQLGGVSSFNRIRTLLGYSPKYVQQIEVRLIQKGILEINNKGRMLKEDKWK